MAQNIKKVIIEYRPVEDVFCEVPFEGDENNTQDVLMALGYGEDEAWDTASLLCRGSITEEILSLAGDRKILENLVFTGCGEDHHDYLIICEGGVRVN